MAEFKIKDIEALTGVKSHTIRIWEKRYNILIPERTASKIRTYSEDDLTRLLNVSILNKNGLKISKIAQLSDKEIKEEVKRVSFSKDSESAVLSLLISALIDFDEPLFKRVLSSVIAKESLKSAYFNYILPFLDRIGIMWLVGTINPSQEHFISNLIRETIIIETNKLPSSEGGKNYVLFCREGDWHELSLLLYNYLLRDRGEKTFYLGQNLPYDGLIETVSKLNIDAITTSLIAPLDIKTKDELIRFAKELNLPFYIGGAHSEVLLNSNPDKKLFKDIKELFV